MLNLQLAVFADTQCSEVHPDHTPTCEPMLLSVLHRQCKGDSPAAAPVAAAPCFTSCSCMLCSLLASVSLNGTGSSVQLTCKCVGHLAAPSCHSFLMPIPKHTQWLTISAYASSHSDSLGCCSTLNDSHAPVFNIYISIYDLHSSAKQECCRALALLCILAAWLEGTSEWPVPHCLLYAFMKH